MIKQTFQVSGMHCTNCAMNLERLEDELPGIRQVSANYKKEQMTVEYDETVVGLSAIAEAVSQKGYQLIR